MNIVELHPAEEMTFRLRFELLQVQFNTRVLVGAIGRLFLTESGFHWMTRCVFVALKKKNIYFLISKRYNSF